MNIKLADIFNPWGQLARERDYSRYVDDMLMLCGAEQDMLIEELRSEMDGSQYLEGLLADERAKRARA
jgi:hypothetical protein